jgi:hypothetical protein
MAGPNVSQKLNLLPEVDFQQLILDKNQYIYNGDGAITIHPDGSVTKDTTLKEINSGQNKPNDYLISKDSIFNYQYTIQGFEPYIGKSFTKALEAINEVFLSEGLLNPRPYMVRAYRHNKLISWHRHVIPKGVKPSNFRLAIYYMHPNWDTNYGGQLHVGITEKDTCNIFECFSNSVIYHDGYLGHEVKDLVLGYKGDRDILLSHWIVN